MGIGTTLPLGAADGSHRTDILCNCADLLQICSDNRIAHSRPQEDRQFSRTLKTTAVKDTSKRDPTVTKGTAQQIAAGAKCPSNGLQVRCPSGEVCPRNIDSQMPAQRKASRVIGGMPRGARERTSPLTSARASLCRKRSRERAHQVLRQPRMWCLHTASSPVFLQVTAWPQPEAFSFLMRCPTDGVGRSVRVRTLGPLTCIITLPASITTEQTVLSNYGSVRARSKAAAQRTLTADRQCGRGDRLLSYATRLHCRIARPTCVQNDACCGLTVNEY